MTKELTAEDLQVGKWYRAKSPRMVGKTFGNIDGEPNDRQIIWIGLGQLQYDGPSVKLGARYPEQDIEKFLKWAGRELTVEEMKAEGLMD